MMYNMISVTKYVKFLSDILDYLNDPDLKHRITELWTLLKTLILNDHNHQTHIVKWTWQIVIDFVCLWTCVVEQWLRGSAVAQG